MKIVLDTNVFISGIFFGGPPSKILKLWRQSHIRIILTKEILQEYQRCFPPWRSGAGERRIWHSGAG
jgi:putative PIN family toxin of toxin-antitoxin system